MSGVQTSTSRRADEAREKLHEGMRWTVQRGRLLASLSIVLLCIAVLIGGLFIVAIKDVLFDLPDSARLALLVVLLLGSLGACIFYTARPWLNARFSRAAGEQIDHAAQDKHQPVTVGLSMDDILDDDSLALALLQRAETRATDMARTISPKKAYPLRLLRRPSKWLALTLGLWLILAFIMPSQMFALLSRVLLPWSDTPPFSLTQLDPTWEPEPPNAGEDVLVSVEPGGLMPEAVDWIRLDEQGNEAERYPMASDGQGGFSHALKQLASPIDFRLEAFGRHTRTFTITPTPLAPSDQAKDDSEEKPVNAEGSTTFDPDKVARRDLASHRDWPNIKADIEQLLQALANAQATADRLAPADLEALTALAAQFDQLIADADAIAGKLAAIQGELPAEASALLAKLKSALTNMQSAALPAPPSQSTPGSGQPTPSEWLDQAAEAGKADQQQIGKGLGPSDVPTESGTASGNPGGGPDIRDHSTAGTYDEASFSGEDGPLPDAVMRQVPPSYRAHVSAYFERLAEE